MLNLPALESIKLQLARAKPFSHAVVDNVLDESFAAQVYADLLDEQYFLKSNDLYDFQQTEDLRLSQQDSLRQLRQLFVTELRAFLSQATGIPLTDSIDMAGQQYHKHGYLQCHDDELESRRIAYILYLSKDWEEGDGGALDLFETQDGLPTKPSNSILPQWNRLAFFEVTEKSFHRVQEILSDKTRVSITGWFHGPPIKRKPISDMQLHEFKKPIEYQDRLIDWVTDKYTLPGTKKQMQEEFLNTSVLHVTDFLQHDKCGLVQSSLSIAKWQSMGPANIQSLSIGLPSGPSAGLMHFLQSKKFFSFLKDITGLDLVDVSLSQQQFSAGDYTLMHDKVVDDPGLDLYVGMSEEWDHESGGQVVYVGDEGELLSIPPALNTLTLVYRDEEARRFTKYVNSSAKKHTRVDFRATYRVQEE